MGSIVRNWRTAHGLSPEKLASRVALKWGRPVSRQNIENFERGTVEQPRYLAALAAVMGYTVEQLILLKEPPTLDAPDVTDSLESYAGSPKFQTRVPVVGTAKMGDDGFYDELGYPEGHGDGWVPGFSADKNVYALRVRGDSMSPAIENGQYVIVEPNSAPTPGEKVIVALKGGKKMVKKLMLQRADHVTVMSVNGGEQKSIYFDEIEFIHAVVGTIEPSKWHPE